MKRHTVKQGEDIAGIAEQHGCRSWRWLYEHAVNAELRTKRPDPFTLRPGDVVNIPTARAWLKRSCATGKVHVFGHKAVAPLSVLLHLRFDRGDPKASRRYALKRYELRVDGQVLEGLTASDAQLHHAVPLAAKQAELALWLDGDEHEPERWQVDLSHLDPIEAISGIKGRMINLGFMEDSGKPLDDKVDEATKRALSAYEIDRPVSAPKSKPKPKPKSGTKQDPRARLEARARPDFSPGPEYLEVGRSHRLRLRPKPRRVYLRLAAAGGSPYAERPFELEVDGTCYEGTTSEDAEVDLEIPAGAGAREAVLRVMIDGLDEPEQWDLELGESETGDAVAWSDEQDEDELDEPELDEASEDARFIAALVNLGFLDASKSEDGCAVSQSTAIFQAIYGLTPSGEIDGVTLSRMRSLARG